MLENVIISNLLKNEEYQKKVFPYIKNEYFDDPSIKKIFDVYSDYYDEYKQIPSIETLKIMVNSSKDINESSYKSIMEAVDSFKIDDETNQEWLVNETEKFCQDRDLYNSIRKSILILDGKEKHLDKGSIPKLLSDSLGINFDTRIGHNYTEDYESRYEYYHKKEERLEFDIDMLNRITKGGLPRKSMTVFLASSGVGKSLIMGHIATASWLFGKNVLYITLELSEEEIARRIDANAMNITVDEVKEVPLDVLKKRMNRFSEKTTGRLIIKEYPTGSAHSGHFRHVINELRMKENFVPDMIIVDYLGICASARVKGSDNSYNTVKAISEEIRALGMEFNAAVVTAGQVNRSAYGDTDFDLNATSESMGIVHSADAVFALISSEELESLGQIMIKQLKNRWGDISYYRRFVVGIVRSKMKLFNLEDVAQKNVYSEAADANKKQQNKVNLSSTVKDKLNTLFNANIT